METIVISGARDISAAVGIPYKEIARFIREEGLPAWKIKGKGNWMALPEDLRAWALRMRDENMGKPVSTV